MILKCTTTQDWHLAMARSSGVSSQRKEMKDFEQPIFFANCVAVNLGLKFILITLSVAICEICSQEDGDEGTLSKHHEVEFREK